MAELAAAIISAIMWISKTAYDQTLRVYEHSHEELERVRKKGAENLRRSVGCIFSSDSESDDEEEPPSAPVVAEKKTPLALMVLGAAIVAHVVRRATVK